MKKKFIVSSKDKKAWTDFIKNPTKIKPKNVDILQAVSDKQVTKKLDLHGLSLAEANKAVENFIEESFSSGEKKILVITGKGSRSQSAHNPYVSEKLSVLKYSIPEFIKNNKNISKKVIEISKSNKKDGGDGAIYIFLKNKKKL